MQPVPEAHRLQFGAGALVRPRPVGEFQRQGDVLQGRHGRHEVEGLEHDADPPPPEPGERVLVEAHEIGLLHEDLAGIGPLQPAITISSVDLPEPDGPTRPTASPRPTASEIPRRTWTRAGPRRG